MKVMHNTNIGMHSPDSITKAWRVSKLCARVAYLKNVKKCSDKEIGKITCTELKTLGPTFVKIGQFMSTRSDVFGKDFTNELKTLQDNILPVPLDQYPNNIAFDNFAIVESEPIAAASIGQVHKAKLKTGEDVVIKVKRHQIEKVIENDFNLLIAILTAIQSVYKTRQTREVEILLREYYGMLKEEVNFEKEQDNMEVFKQMFKNKKWIKVPMLYRNVSTNDYIVMEYVPSTKINDVSTLKSRNLDLEKVCEKLIECYIDQIIEHGYVHIDPHPGNVGMTNNGQIVFYDYGMVLYIDSNLMTNFKKLLLALYDKDIDRVCEILVNLDIVIVEEGKFSYFKRFVASFLSYIDNLDINEFKISYIDRVDPSEMPFLLTSKFLLLLRGLSILEGVCKQLNPDFNYRMILDPYINDISLDLEYIERRGNRDIMRFKNAPDKIALNEISVGIIENDIQKMKKDMQVMSNSKRMLGFLSLILVLGSEFSIEVKCLLSLSTFLLLNK